MGSKEEDDRVARAIDAELEALYRVAWRLSSSRHEAEDLVQEVCLKAWKGRRAVLGRTEIRGWLFRTLRNAWIDRLRRDRGKPKMCALDDGRAMAEAAIGDASSLPAEDQEALEWRLDEEVALALRELGEEERMTLLMHALADLSYQAIAYAMDCPLGTVMSRLHRVRHRLRSRLASHAVAVGIFRRAAPNEEVK